MPTEKAVKLLETLKFLDQCLASGMKPFVAMSCALEDEDWLLALVAFKTLVMEAQNA